MAEEQKFELVVRQSFHNPLTKEISKVGDIITANVEQILDSHHASFVTKIPAGTHVDDAGSKAEVEVGANKQ